MNVNRPSEYVARRKLFLELEIQRLIRDEWPFVITHFVSLGFCAGHYFRITTSNASQTDIGRWMLIGSGLLAFGMMFWTSSTLITLLRMKRQLRHMELTKKEFFA